MEDLQREKIILAIRKLDAELIKLQRDMKQEDRRIIIIAIGVTVGLFGFCFAILRYVLDRLARG